MKSGSDGLPQLGRSARMLGIRTANEMTKGEEPDVTVKEPDEIIQPGTGGMSISPDSATNLPPFRRPASLGGRGKDIVWVIDVTDLGQDLQFRQDSATHGLIEPAREMTLLEFEQAIETTRSKWAFFMR
jgi:hypothetical protein